MNKNKGEMLIKEVLYLSLFLIVVALVFVPFGTKIYSFFKKSEVNQAQSVLDMIQGKIDFMVEKENPISEFIIESLNNWYLILDKDIENRLCICEENSLKKCDEKFCKKINSNKKIGIYNGNYIKLDSPLMLIIFDNRTNFNIFSENEFEEYSKENSEVFLSSFNEIAPEERDVQKIIELMNYAKDNSVVSRNCLCKDKCDVIAKNIIIASKEYNIPDSLLLMSIMMQESSCKYDVKNADSVGLMQITKLTFDNVCKNKINGVNLFSDIGGNKDIEIKNNIYCGAKILRSKYDSYKKGHVFYSCFNGEENYYGWAAAIRGYNGWRCPKDRYNKYIQNEIDLYAKNVLKRFEKLKGIYNELNK